MNIKAYIRTSEFARLISRHPDTVRRLHREGKLVPKFIDKDKKRYYTMTQVKQFLKSNGESK